MIKDQMNRIYSTMPLDIIPWNIKNPPQILTNLVEKEIIKPCKIIDLGCGAGNYILYLAKKGFDATGLDISESAIQIAKNSALEKGIKCNFIVASVMDYNFDTSKPFDCAYDWEVLHHVFPEQRAQYISNVSKLLKSGGQYMSVCFSEDSPQFGGKGKFRKTPIDTELYFSSENELRELFEGVFNIEQLETIDIEGKFGTNRAIYAFMNKKR
ncbi:MAG: class I SAM-dependent methyltransferase [Syntrophobacterales bacterium]|nr:class I SAM-dependent methyltransferase [Syntrophobacterales bacterium]